MQPPLDWRCAAALFLWASRVGAQQVQGSVTITGGSATDVVGTSSRALSVLPSLSFIPDPRLVLGLGGNGTRYDDQRWSIGGQASAAGRLPLGSRAAFTLDADGGMTTTSYDFSYTTASALPAMEGSLGPLTAYAGVSGAIANTRLTRAIPGAPGLLGETPLGASSSIEASRTSHGVVFGANTRVSSGTGENVVLGVREHHSVVDTFSLVDRSASLATSSGRLALSGTLGVRGERSSQATFGNAALVVAVDPRFAIQVAGGAYPADRLIGTPGGRFVSLGVSLRTGRAERRLPGADGAPALATGMSRLTIREADAHRVDVAGDFSNWKPIAAARARNGVWFVDLRIPPGQYRYAFRVDGTTWAVPDGAATVNDGFGGKSAWLIVSETPNSSAR
jgi:hypothetical protein